MDRSEYARGRVELTVVVVLAAIEHYTYIIIIVVVVVRYTPRQTDHAFRRNDSLRVASACSILADNRFRVTRQA